MLDYDEELFVRVKVSFVLPPIKFYVKTIKHYFSQKRSKQLYFVIFMLFQ